MAETEKVTESAAENRRDGKSKTDKAETKRQRGKEPVRERKCEKGRCGSYLRSD